ncbi:MAG: PaaI family thioesterase [Actinomycetota bacterium]|nr:PaaI family thioesterase [Actinomycetota bacterium]
MSENASGPAPSDLTEYPGFDRLIGLQVVEVGPERVEARLEVRPDHHQPFGIVHGGLLATMVETVASVGAAVWYGDRGTIVGVANSTDFFRATREGTLTAVGTPVHQGRTSQLWLVEITDDQGRRVARGQLRVANLEARAAQV